MTKTKEKKYLKDTIATKVLNAEECRDYVIRIIALSLNMDEELLRKNLTLIHPKIGVSKDYKNQETDVLLENDEMFIDIEINYTLYQKGLVKNSIYIGNLMVRQAPKGKDYGKIKAIKQINLSNYDFYGKGEFIYHSYMMEGRYHEKRDDFIEIVDINLEYLTELSYTKIKKLDERDLEWLLYIFVSADEKVRSKLYNHHPLMGRVKRKMDEFHKALDEMLYYDNEESRFQEGKRLGKEEGITLGRKENQKEIVQNLLKENMTISFIQKVTQLSEKEIEKIKEEFQKSQNL